MSDDELKTKILYLLDLASREEQAFLAVLSDEERACEGKEDSWSAKDILAHITSWKERLLDYLSILPEDRTGGKADINSINQAIFLTHRSEPWGEIFQRSEGACENLIQRVQSLENKDLLQTYPFPYVQDNALLSDRTLWKYLVWFGYAHPLFHLAQYYAEFGPEPEGKSYSSKILREATEFARELELSFNWDIE